MKTFCIVYVPHHRHDKEWVNVQDVDKKSAIDNFMGGTLISIEETDDEFDEEEGM